MHCLAFARARPHIWALRDALWGAGAPTSPRANPETIMNDRQHASIRIFGRELPLPRSRPLRIALGVLLILLGFLGFLPVLGFWMIPLGLLVLSHDFAVVRRQRRKLTVWWERRRTRAASRRS